MRRTLLKSKLHRLRVTHADLEYEGSLTLDPSLLEAADILPFEQIHVWNVTRGTRFITYALVGEPDSGVVCVNGAAAHLSSPNDIIIVATFAEFDEAEAKLHRPRAVFVDEQNRVRPLGPDEVPGPARRP